MRASEYNVPLCESDGERKDNAVHDHIIFTIALYHLIFLSLTYIVIAYVLISAIESKECCSAWILSLVHRL